MYMFVQFLNGIWIVFFPGKFKHWGFVLSWMKQILYTCETIYIWLDYRKEWTRVLAHSRQKRMSPWLCPCDLPTFSVPSSPTTALPACLVSGTMCRRRDYQMKYPESIILGFMEFTYFYLIIYLYSSFNCALSENLWIATPTVKQIMLLDS